MLEVVNGYIFHELHLMLASIGVTHMISCGKYLIWIIGLLTPWDPGRMVFDLKFVRASQILRRGMSGIQ
jgi:hypothetical protein